MSREVLCYEGECVIRATGEIVKLNGKYKIRAGKLYLKTFMYWEAEDNLAFEELNGYLRPEWDKGQWQYINIGSLTDFRGYDN